METVADNIGDDEGGATMIGDTVNEVPPPLVYLGCVQLLDT